MAANSWRAGGILDGGHVLVGRSYLASRCDVSCASCLPRRVRPGLVGLVRPAAVRRDAPAASVR
jgi:hypothetical protein